MDPTVSIVTALIIGLVVGCFCGFRLAMWGVSLMIDRGELKKNFSKMHDSPPTRLP